MTRALILAAAMALSAGLAHAQALDGPGVVAAPAAATTAQVEGVGLKRGMIVRDRSGEMVGRISDIGRTADGSATVTIDVDGKDVRLTAANLALSHSGRHAISSISKEKLKYPAG